MGCAGSSSQAPQPGKSPTASDGDSAKQNATAKGEDLAVKTTADGNARIVMKKYTMSLLKPDIMGEGASSICRKGTNTETQEALAIKIYKATVKAGSKQDGVMMLKFRRQIEVLTKLQEPFTKVEDPALWCDALASAKPSSLFMVLTDYSKDASGAPGKDPDDGVVYVITELAQYSLKDYLALRNEQKRSLPKDSVKSITRAVILVVAGLHAKGLAHLDLKPENLMLFNSRLKLIDVDGCVQIGSTVSITDSSISFSPCYCAPEWAVFLISDNSNGILIAPALDVWSVGMTICEFVVLSAVLKPMYGNFLRNAHSHREAGFLFMDWLSSTKKVPLPKSIEQHDPELADLLQQWLLVCDKAKRKSCAQALSHPYVVRQQAGEIGAKDMDMTEKEVERTNRSRSEDTSLQAPLYKGTLWKLNTNGDKNDNAAWLKRDMWIAAQGGLCYFSQKDNKRLVLVDGAGLADAKITRVSDACAKKNAFQIQYKGDDDDDKFETLVFACDDPQEYQTWTMKLKSSVRMDMPTMKLGADMHDLRKFIITVRNRRQKVEEGKEDQFEPVYKAMLWKLKAESDRTKKENWFEREMWIAKNGSMVYYSKKEERNLVYYSPADLLRATYKELPREGSALPFPFQVILPRSGDVEYAPGEFAADTKEKRDTWIKNFKKFAAGGPSN